MGYPSPGFIISLDFELFWGVGDEATLSGYRKNVEGEWRAIPMLLALFRRYGVGATWATVGMVMCRDYKHWNDHRPTKLPSYVRQHCSTYSFGRVAREYPKLFFARPLVERILETPQQELASHTYSHFLCGEVGVTPEQFSADLACAQAMASDLGIQCQSLVFPRNQIRKEFLAKLPDAGFHAYRGNPDHWLYRGGHLTPGGIAGRAVRFADAWLSLTGAHVAYSETVDGLFNMPASMFLRPWSRQLANLEPIRVARLKQSMTIAAREGGIFHLWWHPHNFGINIEQNFCILESLLQHYCVLKDQYGMRSLTMNESRSLVAIPE